MSIRPTVLGGVALLLFFGLSPGFAQETPPQTPPQPPAVQQAPANAEAPAYACADCHEDQAKAFAGNPHAHGGVTTAVCESCHGNGAAHAEAGGDTSLINVPRGFEGAEKTCASCHNKTTERRTHRVGAHANTAAVNCLSCHSIHQPAEPVHLVAKAQPALCATCHGPQAAAFRNNPNSHRINEGAGMRCSTCHDPHARPGRENVRQTAAGESVCLGCHSDKRGPYVFSHGGTSVAESDCVNCHQPHGSGNPHQLKRANVAQLCLECHSPLTGNTLGSQPPSFHNLTNPRYQNCTTCHVAIHGSNRSPQLLK